ncbi:MAG: hypothetical protein E7399_01750 [Ruminococcaceae bacterium]|nr:hypothetical protein [Oscillospiraceae bacterium]
MATYYIDANNGSNTNDGLSEQTPLQNDRELALTLKPGDTVLFKRGTFIRDHLHNVCGEEGNPITYASYGEGEQPIFCGSVDLSDVSLWRQEEPNLWVCDSLELEAGNLVFNHGTHCGTLRWEKKDLCEQGDFYDNCFGLTHKKKTLLPDHALYLYSEKNPGEYYEQIECVVFRENWALASNGHDMNFIGLTFINQLHGIAGDGASRNLIIKNCIFSHIGGCVWSEEKRIRYGNAVETWDIGDHIEISYCIFNEIYDSGVTHQGGPNCQPSDGFICHHCLFIKCGMGAYEQRDKLPIFGQFNHNTCVDAGLGFSIQGEELPRYSEIWPEPMGHHIFLWRIPQGTEGGCLEIKNNIFCNAPIGAAIYSIISKEAEDQTIISGNRYYTENTELLNRWNEINYQKFEDYQEDGAVYEVMNKDEIIQAALMEIKQEETRF